MKEEKNPFKKVGIPEQEVPSDMRDKVMDNVNSIKLLLDVTSLFTSNYLETIEGMFKTTNNDSEKNDNNNDNKNNK